MEYLPCTLLRRQKCIEHVPLRGPENVPKCPPREAPNGLPGGPQGAQNPDRFGMASWLHKKTALRASWRASRAETK